MIKGEVSQPKVAIIGAGLAGLTAAYRLHRKGCDVHVYEARMRPGGRVLTAKVGGSYEELGGKDFLDYSRPRNSLKLIEELGLELRKQEKPFTRVYVNKGHIIPYFELIRKIKDTDTLWDRMQQAAASAHTLQDVIHAVFKDPELRLLNDLRVTAHEGSDSKNLDPATFDALYQILLSSLKALQKFDEGQNPTMHWLTLKGGNAQLPLTLAERLKNKINYGHILKSIQKKDEKIILLFNNNKEIAAEKVLFAIPCSVFKDINFAEGLIPSEQFQHMKKLQYSTVGKILFPLELKTKPCEIITSPNVISMLNYNDKVMTFYFGGQQGIFEAQNIEALFAEGLQVVKTVYTDAILKSTSLESAKDSQFVSYKAGTFKSWALDPYAKGSYSNQAPGTVGWLNDIETLGDEKVRRVFRPVNNQIFFAGEHTTILDTLGTMEGAIESGERMARLMI